MHEWLEDALELLRMDAAPGIGDTDEYGRRLAGTARLLAAFHGDGSPGVGELTAFESRLSTICVLSRSARTETAEAQPTNEGETLLGQRLRRDQRLAGGQHLVERHVGDIIYRSNLSRRTQFRSPSRSNTPIAAYRPARSG